MKEIADNGYLWVLGNLWTTWADRDSDWERAWWVGPVPLCWWSPGGRESDSAESCRRLRASDRPPAALCRRRRNRSSCRTCRLRPPNDPYWNSIAAFCWGSDWGRWCPLPTTTETRRWRAHCASTPVWWLPSHCCLWSICSIWSAISQVPPMTPLSCWAWSGWPGEWRGSTNRYSCPLASRSWHPEEIDQIPCVLSTKKIHYQYF